ncbi:MAG TPA: SPOR domain-containing protein [Pyrinomonadaceae bacterium]|nr:SPOR domain-containing protein [Pyrinomonadaceae bacterium]
MSYDFSFSTKALSFVLAGSAFVGIMLFIAGVLIGTNWRTEPTAVANVARTQPVAAPQPEPTIAPQAEPVMSANAAIPPTAAPVEADASSDASTPAKQAHVDAASVSGRRWQAPPAAAAPNDDELRVVQEAESDESDDAEDQAFSVQVGVFVSENDARQLVRQLQQKGYTPIVLAANDDESRLRYSVRIGTYKNMTEAAHAASNIADQEKLKAVVRPLGSL